MSLELVLSSLFPPVFGDVIEFGLNWQPIPFNIEQGHNLISVACAYCPNYISKYYSYILSEEGQNIIANYTELFEKLSRLAGYDVVTPKDAANIYFTFKSEVSIVLCYVLEILTFITGRFWFKTATMGI